MVLIKNGMIHDAIHAEPYKADILVDGEFVEEKKDLNLRFKGSSNQRTIRVPESLKEGRLVLWEA